MILFVRLTINVTLKTGDDSDIFSLVMHAHDDRQKLSFAPHLIRVCLLHGQDCLVFAFSRRPPSVRLTASDGGGGRSSPENVREDDELLAPRQRPAKRRNFRSVFFFPHSLLYDSTNYKVPVLYTISSVPSCTPQPSFSLLLDARVHDMQCSSLFLSPRAYIYILRINPAC
jgi:hypothetical protein